MSDKKEFVPTEELYVTVHTKGTGLDVLAKLRNYFESGPEDLPGFKSYRVKVTIVGGSHGKK